MPDISITYPDGRHEGYDVPPGDVLVIGRGTDDEPVDIAIDSEYVSQRHAEIRKDDVGVLRVVHVTESKTFTKVNDRRLSPKKPVRLAHGDRITIPFDQDGRKDETGGYNSRYVELIVEAKPAEVEPHAGAPPTSPPPPVREPGNGVDTAPPKAGQGDTNDWRSQQETPTTDGWEPRLKVLTRFNGVQEQTILPIQGGRAVIGRDPGCDIVLPHSSVSWRHAELRLDGLQWQVIDRGSTFGVFLGKDEKPIARDAPCDIEHGQVLRLGNVALQFLVSEERAGDTIQGPPLPPGGGGELKGKSRPGVLICALVATLLIIQIFPYIVHRRAKQAFLARQWARAKREAEGVPLFYVGIPAAWSLSERADKEGKAQRAADQIAKFPMPASIQDLKDLDVLLGWIGLGESSVYWSDSHRTVALHMWAYAGELAKRVRYALGDPRDRDLHAEFFAKLPDIARELEDLTEIVRSKWFREIVRDDQVATVEKQTQASATKLAIARKLSKPWHSCIKPPPDNVDDIPQEKAAVDGQLKAVGALSAAARQHGYGELHDCIQRTLAVKSEELAETSHTFWTAKRYMSEAFDRSSAMHDRLSKASKAGGLLQRVAAERLRESALRDLVKAQAILGHVGVALGSYGDGDYAGMMQALGYEVGLSDSLLQLKAVQEKAALRSLCMAAEEWHKSYVRFAERPAQAAELLSALSRQDADLQKQEVAAHVGTAVAKTRAQRLALVAYLAEKEPEALLFARTADRELARRCGAVSKAHEAVTRAASALDARLGPVETRADKATIEDFRKVWDELTQLGKAVEEFQQAEKALLSRADPHFHIYKTPKGHAAEKGHRQRVKKCDALALSQVIQADRKVAELQKTANASVTAPGGDERNRWRAVLGSCHKALFFPGARGRTEEVLRSVLGLLLTERMDLMDRDPAHFWLGCLRDMRDLPNLSDEVRRQAKIKYDYLLRGL